MTHFNLTFRKYIITQSCHAVTEARLFQGEKKKTKKLCVITDRGTCLQFSKQIKFSGVYSIISEYIIKAAKQVINN